MADDAPPRNRLRVNLSVRLLLLTIIFVMLAEVLIWTPSIARYRKTFIEDYIARAHLSMLALNSMPQSAPDRALETALLRQNEASAIILNRPDMSMLMVGGDMPPEVDLTVDMREGSFFGFIMDAFDTLSMTENRVIRAIGMPPGEPDVTIEVLFDEEKLRTSMIDYSWRILNLSIVISLFTAGLLYISLQWMIVRPIRRLTRAMATFRDNPEDATRLFDASDRTDEIGVAQAEFLGMQKQVQASLLQKTRLAALGTVMAKVNHDLRNTLATAVLVSDKLQYIEDPEVKRVTPRLMKAIDRAIDLCSQTLNYATDDAITLRPRTFLLWDFVDEIRITIADDHPDTEWHINVADDLEIVADRRQLIRAFFNICKNAVQAGATRLQISVLETGSHIFVDVADDGPGLPQKARENLFQPFAASGREGGSGLGLVIVKEVMMAHGGEIELLKSDKDGTTFRLSLPTDIEVAATGATEPV